MHEKTKVISNYMLCHNIMLISYKELIFCIYALLGHYMDNNKEDMSLHCKKEADLPKVNSTLA